MAPFVKVVAELCSDSVSDIIRTSFGDTLVVPTRSRALCAAVASQIKSENVTVLITPTHSEAQALAGDLVAFLGEDKVELLPAWETLPFERVSPAIETMGHRCRVQSRIKSKNKPQVVVCSVRAAIQKVISTKQLLEIK